VRDGFPREQRRCRKEIIAVKRSQDGYTPMRASTKGKIETEQTLSTALGGESTSSEKGEGAGITF
jgi:hypothetical protein